LAIVTMIERKTVSEEKSTKIAKTHKEYNFSISVFYAVDGV